MFDLTMEAITLIQNVKMKVIEDCRNTMFGKGKSSIYDKLGTKEFPTDIVKSETGVDYGDIILSPDLAKVSTDMYYFSDLNTKDAKSISRELYVSIVIEKGIAEVVYANSAKDDFKIKKTYHLWNDFDYYKQVEVIAGDIISEITNMLKKDKRF